MNYLRLVTYFERVSDHQLRDKSGSCGCGSKREYLGVVSHHVVPQYGVVWWDAAVIRPEKAIKPRRSVNRRMLKRLDQPEPIVVHGALSGSVSQAAALQGALVEGGAGNMKWMNCWMVAPTGVLTGGDSGAAVFMYTGCALLAVTAFRAKDAVNGRDFNFSLPASEIDASAFVKSRSDGTGKVDRRIALVITYSVVNDRWQQSGTEPDEYSRPIFSPFIYSVEAYPNTALTAKLGIIPKINAIGADTAEELRLATIAAKNPY